MLNLEFLDSKVFTSHGSGSMYFYSTACFFFSSPLDLFCPMRIIVFTFVNILPTHLSSVYTLCKHLSFGHPLCIGAFIPAVNSDFRRTDWRQVLPKLWKTVLCHLWGSFFRLSIRDMIQQGWEYGFCVDITPWFSNSSSIEKGMTLKGQSMLSQIQAQRGVPEQYLIHWHSKGF